MHRPDRSAMEARGRPLLLASLADPGEAGAAVAGGADIVDVKDPRRGALGACDPEVLRAVAIALDAAGPPRDGAARPPISAALGDVRDAPASGPGSVARLASACAAAGALFLKLGLAGAADPRRAAAVLREAARAARDVRPGARLVAVSYADHGAAEAPVPALLPGIAAAAGADGCLLDTCEKNGRTLLDVIDPAELRAFVSACRAEGLLCALAGSLAIAQLPAVAALRPDIVGARGALCRNGRAGRLDAARVRVFRDALLAAARAPRTVPVAGAEAPIADPIEPFR